MKFVAIDTVRDEGAAAILDEALRAENIPIELKRMGMSAWGQAVEIEVRVPEERLDDALAILAQLELEAEDALTIEAGKPEPVPEPVPEPDSVEGPVAAVFMRFALVGIAFFFVFLCGAAYYACTR